MQVDYLIVGSGLTGAVLARILADAGREVMIVDRRAHAGGNVHDHTRENSIRVHSYGPHYFRTSSEKIWEFATRFSPFYSYAACVKSLLNGVHEDWPLGISYIRRTLGEKWKPGFNGKANNFEEASLSRMPREIYEKYIRGYAEKLWGMPAQQLPASLAEKFEIRMDDDPRLKCAKYQGLPTLGYAGWISNMLSGVDFRLGFDYLKNREAFTARRLLIFTGPIDEYFSFALGRLPYRGQAREHLFRPEAEFVLPCAQVNNPSLENGSYIRTIEWKHLLPPEEAKRIKGTILTFETPFAALNPDEFEYPFSDKKNQLLYKRYREIADKLEGVLICGRLGEYRYYDMDQAIDRAMTLAEHILVGESAIESCKKGQGTAA